MNNWATRFLIYSISGIIISGLQNSNKTKKTNMNLPEFKNVLEVKHALQGRIRFNIPSIKGDFDKVNFLINNFNKIEGVNHIEVNSITGSLLLKYDDNKIKPVLIMGIIIKLLSLEKEVEKEPESLITKETDNLRDAVNFAVYNKTNGILDSKNVIMITLIILGIRKIMINPGMNISGATSLWWAYSLIRMK